MRFRLAVLRHSTVYLYTFSDVFRSASLKLAAKGDSNVRKIRSLEGVAPIQYINRLIEYYDGAMTWDAAKEYALLVSSGIDPEHAFRMLTER